MRVLGVASVVLGLIVFSCSSDDSSSNDKPDGGTLPDGSTSTGGSSGNGGSSGSSGSGGGGGGSDDTLSAKYPGDQGLADDPAVLLFDDFESGWGRWDQPTSDTQYLTIQTDSAEAHAGNGYLKSTVTFDDLDAEQYISSKTVGSFESVDTLYWRFYARFPHVAPNPHHWVRVEAGDDSWSSSGLANTVPPGDEGFWFDFDIGNDDQFNFYVYWHEMRSGRCNDGSATPGCEGDQGTTYYYGNVFKPAKQTAFQRDQWFCIEGRAEANTVGDYDGSLAFWIEEQLVGDYHEGHPLGTWLRATFHEGGCSFSACTDPVPFEGFNFRTEADVRFKRFFLDAYYERDSAAEKKQELEAQGLTVSEEQTILYDDVVLARERIGCQKPAP